MTALTKEWPEARHALLACLCFVASLLLGLAGTADAAYGSAPAAGIVVQQVSHGSLMLPHQSCPARAQAQGSGTCTSVSVVGLSPPASGYTPAAQPHDSCLAPAEASATAQLYGSRLERPPRF
jgi:hypothetical protein